jgi:hypothetical protein
MERLPVQRKLQLLLLVCDGLEVDEKDPVIIALKAVVEQSGVQSGGGAAGAVG